MDSKKGWLLVIGILVVLAFGAWGVIDAVRVATERTLQPIGDTTGALGTQVALALHPVPTLLPDPVTVVQDIRALARLETVQYSVEKVITAEIRQEFLPILFGDRLLFVAHGVVIAGVDLQKLGPKDMWVENGVLYVDLPAPEIFITTLDNEKSYVYDRQQGVLSKGDVDLETNARRAAEESIREAVLADGILDQAQTNAEAYFLTLFHNLGYPEVIFIEK